MLWWCSKQRVESFSRCEITAPAGQKPDACFWRMQKQREKACWDASHELNRTQLFNFTWRFSCTGMCEREAGKGSGERPIGALICTIHFSRPSPWPLWQMTTLLFQMANPSCSPKSIRKYVDGVPATNMNKHGCIASGCTHTYSHGPPAAVLNRAGCKTQTGCNFNTNWNVSTSLNEKS